MNELGVIIDTNKMAELMLQRNREDIVGSKINTVDPNYPIEAFLEFWKNTPYEEQRIFETTHIRSDGVLIPIEISGKKFKIEDETLYFGIARDLSERKKAEEKLKASEDLLLKAENIYNQGSWKRDKKLKNYLNIVLINLE
jgi:PAS domain S-box-containing protein